jgi:DnaJ homolog subfamily C member 28
MRSIEDQIRKAIEEGQFKDLPGKGKPLNLDENVPEDPEWRMANHVLKNAGYTLPWIEKRQEILAALDFSRETFQRAWAWRQAALEKGLPFSEVEQEWQRALVAFREQMAELDQRIRNLNLEIPNGRFQLPRVKIDKEIAAICSQDGTPPQAG